MKVVTIVGARPQFIKAAVTSEALRTAGVVEILLHTGQHFDDNMSAVFFKELGIADPAFNLGIGGGSHGQNTGRMLEAIESVLQKVQPDGVLVYGDTDSTLAGTLAAVKLRIPVAHVEAGLRSFNRDMPEEINRILTDHAAALLFAPTNTAVSNLAHEGIPDDRIQLVGDVMYDAALHFGAIAEHHSNILDRLALRNRPYVLATVHRAENADNALRMRAILEGFARCDQQIVLPLHPRTRARLTSLDLRLPANVHAIDPVGFLDMVMLEKQASVIATDSGGVQKEAFFHRVPCVTLRDQTEWTELVDAGWNRLVSPTSADHIATAIRQAIGTRGAEFHPYGFGNASAQIAEALAGGMALPPNARLRSAT